MQYFTPGGHLFAGDCMPFFDGRTFHLYYLLDEDHHQGLGGLGGHQWAHASSQNLIEWVQHPLALAISDAWEGSICTGSVVLRAGTYHAFYATRARDYTQHLGHATSADGISFQKATPNPFLSAPPGYSPTDFRDPCVFQGEDGQWHMLVTSQIIDFPLDGRGGCLLHLHSADLWEWMVDQPLLIPGGAEGYPCIPECPDYFVWNGWHYLLFGLGLQTHYRMARQLHGPWLRPAHDILDSQFCAVMKTAAFGDRRIGAGWAGPRRENRDDGGMLWGGRVVFRELLQQPDGTLGMRFPAELIPACGPALTLVETALTAGCRFSAGQVQLEGPTSQEVGALAGLPRNCRIQCRVTPAPATARFGLGLRGSGRYAQSYELAFDLNCATVTLAQQRIDGMLGLDQLFTLDIMLVDDLIDVCVDQRRCLITRLPANQGDQLFLFCEQGAVTFTNLVVQPLLIEPM